VNYDDTTTAAGLVSGPVRRSWDTLWTSAIQRADGRIEPEPGPPRVHIEGDVDLNRDQARELAAVLLEVAAELDGWTR
jgi:hypothetical protein